MTKRNGISGHTSQETAYTVSDYPYGQLRCTRRVWIESNPKRGFRFVAQTQNPKNGRWNAPHKSTYVEIAAALFLDEKNHVQWTGITPYTSPAEALTFAQDFGNQCEGAAGFQAWAKQKAAMGKALAAGTASFSISGVKQDRSEAERARDLAESQVWAEVSAALAG